MATVAGKEKLKKLKAQSGSGKVAGKRPSGIKKKKKPAEKKPAKPESDNEEYESDDSEDYSNSDDEGRSGYRKGGYHPVKIGDKYKDRYTIERKLGWGHFSTVWLASDSTRKKGHHHKLVALKIQKSASQYYDAAEDEIELLGECNKKDPEEKLFVVSLIDHFIIYGPNGKHICMVFEVMGENLLSLIKRYDYHGIPLELVKIISYQALVGLEFLHDHCQIIHTDLKPENFLMAMTHPLELEEVQQERKDVLDEQAARRLARRKLKLKQGGQLSKNQKKRLKAKLKKEKELAKQKKLHEQLGKDDGSDEKKIDEMLPFIVKIGDLGNACWVHKHFTDDVTTRQYRAPEVIVGYPYSTPIDIWSMACMVFELITGDYLFDPKEDDNATHSRDEDHLALMIELIGDMPKKLATKGKYAKHFFSKKGGLKNIKDLEAWGLREVLHEKYKLSDEDADMLSSFLLPMLDLNPDSRASASQMLEHRWFADLRKAHEAVGEKAFLVPAYQLDPALLKGQLGRNTNANADDNYDDDDLDDDDDDDEEDDEEYEEDAEYEEQEDLDTSGKHSSRRAGGTKAINRSRSPSPPEKGKQDDDDDGSDAGQD